jgi:excisionase family DNA binding protein
MKEAKVLINRLLTRSEVADIFQVSPSTVTRWAEAGKLPMVKTLGGHRRYEANTVLKLVEQLTEETKTMEKVTINVPAMYGDHHVQEVRQILIQLPGVETVYASSCFRTVDVEFNPVAVDAVTIKTKLREAGYLGELAVPEETPAAPAHIDTKKESFFRHTAAYAQTNQVVGFEQNVKFAGRPLWPCPGIGVVTNIELEEAHV